MENEKKPGLLPKLNLFDATLLVIGAVIGSGIFLTSGIIAQSLPSVSWIFFVWILGAILTLFGGLTFAELGAMLPEAGGQYVYIREAYGPMAGFMFGWSTFLVIQTGGIAALAVGFAEYLSYFVPVLGLDQHLFAIAGFVISPGQVVAVISISVLTAINYFGIKSGSMVQNIFTILKLVAIGILVIAGLYMVAGSGGESISPPELPRGMALPVAIGIALIAVLWTFDGWYSVNCVASEIKNVKKNLPLSLILGISLIGVIYLLVNLFYVNALPLSEMIGVVRIGEKATTAAFGDTAGSMMATLILVSILGCLSATIIFGPRIYYAMAGDGLFFKNFTRVHPRFHTPVVAIVWQGIWSALLCLTGSYEQLYTYVMFAVLLFYVVTAAAVFVLRKRKPDAERPYRVWGYPVIPAIFTLVMGVVMLNTIIEKPLESIIGLILILLGLPVYFYWRVKK
ncbi:MAG: amino acid permease [Calditrichales bacterium]|nr:MAG: amino acid permease [Calditrichales bacterium]